jgi:pimeloyl-ACP methyl ester carboxylesterase
VNLRKKRITCSPRGTNLPLSLFIVCLVLLLANSIARAADWPPTLDRDNPTPQSLDGRRIERYTHGARADWGYPDASANEWKYPAPQETGPLGQNHNSFYLVFPRKPRRNAPLCVVLHSANRTAFDYLGYQFLNRKVDPSDEPESVMTRVPDDCYALFLNSTNDEWWGWSAARQQSDKYAKTPTPAEKRVLDTISWVMSRQKIDPNRVYLAGVSMGGCGALGIGMPHGDIFAAMLVVVPAGTEFAALRMGFPTPHAASTPTQPDVATTPAVNLPDPPIVLDFSAQNDKWSETQPALLEAAQAAKYPLVLAWGPFGHTGSSIPIAKYSQDDVALAFPWWEVHKNAPYPVFIHASSNQRSPWTPETTGFDDSGQINAYFRWKNLREKTSTFTMKLWLAHPAVKNPPPVMPATSTAEITFRRFQSFKFQPGKSYAWKLLRNGKIAASGTITPGAANLLTIPHLTLTPVPAELSVKEGATTR